MAEKKRILIADSSLTIQKVVRLALANEGYEIQAVSNSTEALEQISLYRPNLVLIDYALPDKGAIEVKKEHSLMGTPSSTRFIVMSSAFEKVNEPEIAELGFAGRLVKPFDPTHLRNMISGVLANDPKPAEESSDDIRKLTEQTVRLSGLENYPWSVQEIAKKELKDLPPPLPLEPPPALLDTGGVSLGLRPAASLTAEESAARFYHEAPEPNGGGTGHAETFPVSQQEMEEMVRAQVEGSVEALARKMIPEMAEKIIRAEIDRLLSEPPNG